MTDYKNFKEFRNEEDQVIMFNPHEDVNLRWLWVCINADRY